MPGSHVITLANSIVGVSVLAMPFCFKQCGAVLATLMLIASAVLTRTGCDFLLKASILTRRRSYELLAYQTLGAGGKFAVEVSVIGYLLGTLVAFLVVMGDVGPEIVAKMFDIENNSPLRSVVMSALALFVALPLSLLRNIESLSSVSAASFLFYGFLVLKILTEGWSPNLDHVELWRPAGVLQCIPIIAMALSCQTQIFSIYESLPDPSLHKMNAVISRAVNICTGFYITVGWFGYVAFGGTSGNILLNLTNSWSTELIKLGFVMSIVFSFPLCIFPCRASLYSLLFRGSPHAHPLQETHMPDHTIRLLTVGIVGVTLTIGLLIPNIELVLGLVGSTAGALVCIIFPSLVFLKVTEGKGGTTERIVAKGLLMIGLGILCLTTYATLYAAEKAVVREPVVTPRNPVLENVEQKLLQMTSEKVGLPAVPEPVSKDSPLLAQDFLDSLKKTQEEQKKLIEEQKSILEKLQDHVKEHQHEPPHDHHNEVAGDGEEVPKIEPPETMKEDPPIEKDEVGSEVKGKAPVEIETVVKVESVAGTGNNADHVQDSDQAPPQPDKKKVLKSVKMIEPLVPELPVAPIKTDSEHKVKGGETEVGGMKTHKAEHKTPKKTEEVNHSQKQPLVEVPIPVVLEKANEKIPKHTPVAVPKNVDLPAPPDNEENVKTNSNSHIKQGPVLVEPVVRVQSQALASGSNLTQPKPTGSKKVDRDM